MEENDLRGLDKAGFTYKNMKFDSAKFDDQEKIEKIRCEIRKYFTKTKGINSNNSSYGLKHILERHIETYVSNGELIYSMHLEGYKIFKVDINCGFNTSKSGIRLLENSNRIKNILGTPLNYEYSDYLKRKKIYLKYKYHLKLIIDIKFWNETNLKRFVPSVIANEIGVNAETVRIWINLLNFEQYEIPTEILKAISQLFNADFKKIINSEGSN